MENKTLFGKHGKQTLAVTGRSKEEVKNWAEVINFLSKVNHLREQPFILTHCHQQIQSFEFYEVWEGES